MRREIEVASVTAASQPIRSKSPASPPRRRQIELDVASVGVADPVDEFDVASVAAAIRTLSSGCGAAAAGGHGWHRPADADASGVARVRSASSSRQATTTAGDPAAGVLRAAAVLATCGVTSAPGAPWPCLQLLLRTVHVLKRCFSSVCQRWDVMLTVLDDNPYALENIVSDLVAELLQAPGQFGPHCARSSVRRQSGLDAFKM